MLRSIRGAAVGLVLLCAAAFAQNPGEWVEGEIKEFDYRGGALTIRTEAGAMITAQVSNRTRITLPPGEEKYFPNPTVWQLAPGMWVRFIYDPNGIALIRVRGVPPETRPTPTPTPTPGPTPRPEAGSGERVLKVRILGLDELRGEFRAQVGSRRETFRAADPRVLRRYAEGDLVIITVGSRGGEELVTDIRSAGLSGRVTRVDRRRNKVWIEVERREAMYGVDDKRLLDDVREGDRVRFEFEDRPGGAKVITAIY